MAKDTHLGIRLSAEVKAALQREAAKDMRKPSALAEKIITEWLVSRGALPGEYAGK